VPAERLWDAARAVRLCDTRTLGRLVSWRIPRTSRKRTFHEVLRSYPFTVLEEGERLLVSGLCGRIWTRARDYPHLRGAEEFARWREPGTVRVLFAHSVRPSGNGRATLISEARVEPVDPSAAVRLRGIWMLLSPFERLVGAEGLTAAVRRMDVH
jgi:hypothetical protein